MTNSQNFGKRRIALLIPCYNEAETIGTVVQNFRSVLPSAAIYVYDNNSRDLTSKCAEEAGAYVRSETRQGKGNVIRRMFADIDADIYVLVDGDDTYDAKSAPQLINKLIDMQLDMVVGSRLVDYDSAAFRHGHRLGNRLLTGVVAALFNHELDDMLSGYRIFSRRYVKSFPALATGFETETELTIHALELRMPIAEVVTPYKSRPAGSDSKLRTVHDGLRILLTVLALFKQERPLAFFSIIFIIMAAASLVIGYPIVVEFLNTGLVPRFPSAILATGIMLLAFLSLASGFILDTVTRGRREQKRLWYLSVPPVSP